MGTFIGVLWQEGTTGSGSSKCSGLAEDEEGRVATIKEGKSEATELLFFDLRSKNVTSRLDIDHAITDRTNSKCRFTHSVTTYNYHHCLVRFLAIKKGKFYISDLGLHHIYVMDSTTGRLLLVSGDALELLGSSFNFDILTFH